MSPQKRQSKPPDPAQASTQSPSPKTLRPSLLFDETDDLVELSRLNPACLHGYLKQRSFCFEGWLCGVRLNDPTVSNKGHEDGSFVKRNCMPNEAAADAGAGADVALVFPSTVRRYSSRNAAMRNSIGHGEQHLTFSRDSRLDALLA